MTGSHRAATTTRRSTGTAASGRRSGHTRIRIVLVTAVSLLVLVTAGAGWAYLRLNGNIDTFGADGVSDDRPAAASDGRNVLVIGSDARTGGNSELGGGDKNDIGRSDTAFLLHVYADHRNAVAVSIPRDTLLDIPPCRLPDGSWTETRHQAMFNEAYTVGSTAEGNPACTQNTVEHLTGLRVDHTVVVDFKGFSALTEVVGGVEVCVPQDIYQKDLNPGRATRGKRLFTEGVQTVSGQKALDYVRIRHGIGDGSDIGRIKRQQAFVGSLLKKVKTDGLTPSKLLPLADAATTSMTVDPGLGSADKLVSFVMSLKDIDLNDTRFVTVPWRYEGARVAIVEPDAGALWAALKADRTLDGDDAGGVGAGKEPDSTASADAEERVPAEDISVTVRNGTRVTRLAARAADVLEEAGVTVTGTATASSQDHRTTVIEYGPGHKEEAETLARLLGTGEVRSGTGGLDVVLGRSYADQVSATPSAVPSGVPAEVTEGARTADEDLCTGLSYG
ncbi:LCP family protein [Streptomyces sp. HB132]|uniref:LCP family protein n=1 Tax=Streptomyces sp. HB132 TaxID=767388 RepID=UPI001960BE76|nr:LCP family protein [Streptomyces sp. HB132]MBM7442240.1 LCP family protein required for cell wall assembly [Streptomyces sp. HB132]